MTRNRQRSDVEIAERMLCAIPEVKPAAARALLDHFGSLESALRADRDRLLAVDGVGPKTIDAIKRVVTADYRRNPEDDLRAKIEGLSLQSYRIIAHPSQMTPNKIKKEGHGFVYRRVSAPGQFSGYDYGYYHQLIGVRKDENGYYAEPSEMEREKAPSEIQNDTFSPRTIEPLIRKGLLAKYGDMVIVRQEVADFVANYDHDMPEPHPAPGMR